MVGRENLRRLLVSCLGWEGWGWYSQDW